VDLAGHQQVAHGNFHQLDDVFRLAAEFRRKALVGAPAHVRVYFCDLAKASPFDQDGFFSQHFRGLQHFSGRSEHGGAVETELHQLEAHHAVVDVPELDARELNHVDLDAIGGEVV